MNILIFENAIVAQSLKIVPGSLGNHELTVYRGAYRDESGNLMGFPSNGATQPERIEPTKYTLALVAGKLQMVGTLGTQWGWDIVPYLTVVMPCIGISTDWVYN